MFRYRPIQSIADRQAQDELTDAVDLGLRVIELRQIVGSVNRWQDFDSKFRLRSRATRQRYERIKRAVEHGEAMPPVKLNKILDKYYVIDGHHRVSAAKQVGQVYIDAYVVEMLPPADSREHLLWRERSHFELMTHLTDIQFTELGSYEKLLHQIEKFRDEESRHLGQKLTLSAAAAGWWEEIYEPVVQQIQQEDLLDAFPRRTAADLFLYISYHRIAKSRLLHETVGYREALNDFLEVTPQRSLAQKIVDTLLSVLHLTDSPEEPQQNIILDEEGRVKIRPDRRRRRPQTAKDPGQELLIRDEETLKKP